MIGKLMQISPGKPHRALLEGEFQRVDFAYLPRVDQPFYFNTVEHQQMVRTSSVKDFWGMNWRGGGWVEFQTRNTTYRLEWGFQQGYIPADLPS